MAYAALTLVLQSIDQVQSSSRSCELLLPQTEQLIRLQGKFTLLRAFLDDHSDKMGKDFEVKIRALAYDAADAIDEFMYEMSSGTPQSSFSLLIEDVDSVNNVVLKIYEALYDIKREDYSTVADSIKNLQECKHQFRYCPSFFVQYYLDRSKKGGLVDFEIQALSIIKRLMGFSERLETVRFSGHMCSTLDRRIRDDPFIKAHFGNIVWIRKQFYFDGIGLRGPQSDQLRYLLLRILVFFSHLTHDILDQMSNRELTELVPRCLKGQRYLIVLDINDIPEAWADIESSLPDDGNRSRILLITSGEQRRSHCPACSGALGNMSLPNEEGWRRFSMLVSWETGFSPELNFAKMEIVRKCKALPSAIITIAAFLSVVEEIVDEDLEPLCEKMVFISERLPGPSEEISYNRSINVRDISYDLDKASIARAESSSEISAQRTKSQDNVFLGLDDDLMKILDWLTGHQPELETLTIVGMGGIGKTTLAREIYNHPMTVYHFYVHAWLTVSQVYVVRDLMLQLLHTITPLTDEIYAMTDEQIAGKLYQCLKGQRYLIVMDDIWNKNAWNDVRRCFPNDKNGSRILLTSRLRNVALHVNPENVHDMRFLNVEESLMLLQRRVFRSGSCPSELDGIGFQIAEKCQGLPLSVVVIAGVLSKIRKTKDCWENVAKDVASVVSGEQDKCLGILALSYLNLPHLLKPMFLYLAAFPEDSGIEASRLVRLWVAEGFLKSLNFKCMEEVGEEYLEDLINRSLVLVRERRSDGGVKTCCIHSIVREFCLRQAQEENFLHVVNGRLPSTFSAGRNNRRRLSFHSDGHLDVHSMPSVPFVRTFLFFGVTSNVVPDTFFHCLDFKLLSTLDISFVRFDNFPEQMVKLHLLRYLAFTATFKLPASLTSLKNLQVLSVYGPWISKVTDRSPILPVEIWEMKHMRHLHFSAAVFLPHQKGYSSRQRFFTLKHLQTLTGVRPSSCTFKSLRHVPNLKKLGIFETKEDYKAGDLPSICIKSLDCLYHLETLKYSFCVQEMKVRRIQQLYDFPKLLKKLTLSGCYLPWVCMTSIGHLPNLEVLKLRNYAFQGPEWELEEGGFLCLKHLLIEKTDLVHWKASSVHFPRLERLILVCCDSLEEIPEDIAEIHTLQLIELHYCSPSSECSARRIQEEQQMEGNEYLNIHIRTSRADASSSSRESESAKSNFKVQPPKLKGVFSQFKSCFK